MSYKKNYKNKKIQHPIDFFQEQQLTTMGNYEGRMIVWIDKVYLKPSKHIEQKTKQSSCLETPYETNNYLDHFWNKKYYLFEKFDQGIILDEQSWYSVTPEVVAQHIARQIQSLQIKYILDGFCGAGGDSLKLAQICSKVYSNDIDHIKLQLLMNNCYVYQISNIQGSCMDFFMLNPKQYKVDVVYLAPPWGGQLYIQNECMSPDNFNPSLKAIFMKSLQFTHNIVMLLPSNIDVQKLVIMISSCYMQKNQKQCTIRIEKIYFRKRFKFIAIYVGKLVQRKITTNDELNYIYQLLKNRENQNIFQHKRVVKYLRQKYGMLKLLNWIFACQKLNDFENYTIINSLYDYIKINQLIGFGQLQKLINQQKNDQKKQFIKNKKSNLSLLREQNHEKTNSQIFQIYKQQNQNIIQL